MIPILYAANENTFTTYGIGALTDCVSCIVYEEYNGEYELILKYPITGKLYEELAAERIIKAKAHDTGNDQLFRIYRMTRPLRGIVTIYAQHISYDLTGIALVPFSGTYTAAGAMAAMFAGTPFTGISDKTGTKTVATTIPKSIRAMLGGSEGSLLDLWGGEYTFDNYEVRLNINRGSDKGVVIEYGKNLTQLEADSDLTDVYTELLPYATYTDTSDEEHVVTAPAITITSVISRTKTLIKDFTEILGLDLNTAPTTAQITAAATSWLADNPLGYETPSLTVSFEPVKGGADYPVVGLDLCDTVTIRYSALGVDVKARIVYTEYNTLTERYSKMTVGKPRASMANTVASLQETAKEVQTYPTRWDDAIANATRLITGNTGGYAILHADADGKPYEFLILDSQDINTAVKVWRWNLNGLGFSSSGYAGPYAYAFTSDGGFNADFINSGTINADLIKAGVLTVLDANNNIIFEADQDTKTVQIGGFTVDADSLHNQTSGSVYDSLQLETGRIEFHRRDGITNDDIWSAEMEPNGVVFDLYDSLTNIIREVHIRHNSINLLKIERDDVGQETGRSTTTITPDTTTMVGASTTNTQTGEDIVISGGGFTNSIYRSSSVMTDGTNQSKLHRNYLELTNGTDTATYGRGSAILTNGTNTATLTPTGLNLDGTVLTSGIGANTKSSTTTVSVPTGTYTAVTSFTITPGIWVIIGFLRFEKNATGRRVLAISTTSGSGTTPALDYSQTEAAVSGTQTTVRVTTIRKVSQNTTFYMNAYQDSGSALSVDGIYNFVRIL